MLFVLVSCIAMAPVLSSQAAVSLVEPVEAAKSYDDLIVEGDQARDAEDYVRSARLYAAAYRALSLEERAGAVGEYTVGLAVADYQTAYDAERGDLSLLEEPIALLEELESDRRSRLGAEAGVLPPGSRAELTRLGEELENRRGERERQEEEVPQAPLAEEPEPVVTPEPRMSSEPKPIASLEPTDIDREDTEPRKSRTRLDWLVTSAGIAAVGGGTALVVVGLWRRREAPRRADAALLALGGNEEQQAQYEGELDAWESGARRNSTAEIIAGSVLMAGGLGLTTWGAVRLVQGRRHRRTSARLVAPMFSRHAVGVSLSAGF